MGPFRTSGAPHVERTSSGDDIVVALVILVVGIVGVAIGLSCGSRTFEAGVGTVMTLFGTYALTNALFAHR